MTATELYRIAAAFRSAVEVIAPFDHFYAALRRYPNGCCKDASFLLARVLDKKHGVSGIEYVWGHRRRLTHGWLEVSGFIVDVTADQFSEVADPVTVVEPQQSRFHQSFEGWSRSTYPAFLRFPEDAAPDFEASATAILAALPE